MSVALFRIVGEQTKLFVRPSSVGKAGPIACTKSCSGCSNMQDGNSYLLQCAQSQAYTGLFL